MQASGKIPSAGRGTMVALWIAALASNLLFVTGFIKYLSNPAAKTAPLIVIGVFALLAIALAVFVIRATIRYLRFGQSQCCINDKAGVLGKTMTGVIRSSNQIPASGDYTVELQCLETYYTGSGKKRRTECKIHWQAKQQVAHLGKNSKMGIPFFFDLPKYPSETGDQLARGTVDWRLSIHAPVEGVDYSARFVVPVFKMDYTN